MRVRGLQTSWSPLSMVEVNGRLVSAMVGYHSLLNFATLPFGSCYSYDVAHFFPTPSRLILQTKRHIMAYRLLTMAYTKYILIDRLFPRSEDVKDHQSPFLIFSGLPWSSLLGVFVVLNLGMNGGSMHTIAVSWYPLIAVLLMIMMHAMHCQLSQEAHDVVFFCHRTSSTQLATTTRVCIFF